MPSSVGDIIMSEDDYEMPFDFGTKLEQDLALEVCGTKASV